MTATLRKVRHRVEVMKKHLKGKLLLSEPMSGHVTLGVGGPADAFFSPVDKDDLMKKLMAAGLPIGRSRDSRSGPTAARRELHSRCTVK